MEESEKRRKIYKLTNRPEETVQQWLGRVSISKFRAQSNPKSKSPLEFLAAAPALECEVESRKDGKLRVNKCNDQSALMGSESDCDRKRKK